MTAVQNRRDFIVLAAGATLAAGAAQAQQQAAAGPKVEYVIKKLPFDPAKV